MKNPQHEGKRSRGRVVVAISANQTKAATVRDAKTNLDAFNGVHDLAISEF
jgi:hypothetical protein